MRFLTDKVTYHPYLQTYLRIAGEIGVKGNVTEVGVLNGASLDMWQALFPQGKIVGVDITPEAYWPPATYRVVADQTDKELPDLLSQISPDYDLIVDDASHEGEKTEATFKLLYPLVKPGGWYVIEDWMVGFATYDNARHGPSMLHMACGLLNLVDNPENETEYIKYQYGQIIVRKKSNAS